MIIIRFVRKRATLEEGEDGRFFVFFNQTKGLRKHHRKQHPERRGALWRNRTVKKMKGHYEQEEYLKQKRKESVLQRRNTTKNKYIEG